MKRKKVIGLLVMCVIAVYTTSANAVTTTIATFDDPAADSTTALFEVDLTNDLITGGWDDWQTNLNLDVVYSGHIFDDAFFTMTPVTYSGDITGGVTGGGVIMFRENILGPQPITPLIRIEFDSAYISLTGFGAVEMFMASNITITGTEIDIPLTNESFSFSFANQAPLSEGEGFTATAAFTSSATIPEPTTMMLFGVGAFLSFAKYRRKDKASVF